MTRYSSTKRRRNFLPSLIITFFLWIVLGIIVYFVDPSTLGVVPAFFALAYFAFLFTFSLILGSSKRGLVASTCLLIFLFFRFFGIGNIVNLLLIAGLGITVMLYLQAK